MNIVRDHEKTCGSDEDRGKGSPDDPVDPLLFIRVKHAQREHQDRVIPPFTLEPVRHYGRIRVAGQKTDHDHDKDDASHDDNSGQRLFDAGKDDPEHDIKEHDLDRKPHLVIDEEQSEETADDFQKIKAFAILDIRYDRICQVDIVTDKERNEHREDPSFHEAFQVGLIRHPSLDQTESGAEEEERDRQGTIVEVIRERQHATAIHAEMIERDHGLMEDDKNGEKALHLLTDDPIEERLVIRGP